MSLSSALGYAIMREIFDVCWPKQPKKKAPRHIVPLGYFMKRLEPISRFDSIRVNPDHTEEAFNYVVRALMVDGMSEADAKDLAGRAISSWVQQVATTYLKNIRLYYPGENFQHILKDRQKALTEGHYGFRKDNAPHNLIRD